MKKTKRFELPNARARLTRQIVAAGTELRRFESGRNQDPKACHALICEDGLYFCDPDIPSGTTPLYAFTADVGGDVLDWVGILSNQPAHDGSNGYWHSSTPAQFSRAHACTSGDTLSISVWGYADTSSKQLLIRFTTQSPGDNFNSIFQVGPTTTLWAEGPAAPWVFVETQVTVPDTATALHIGHATPSSCNFDTLLIDVVNSASPGECRVHYQDGSFDLISGSSAPHNVITYQIVASGSQSIFEFPTSATDVSSVWIDQIPTDVWTWDEESHCVIFPDALANDSILSARYIV